MMKAETKGKYRALLTAIWQDYKNGSLSKEHPKLKDYFRVYNVSPFSIALIEDLPKLESAPDEYYFSFFFIRFEEYRKTWKSWKLKGQKKKCPRCNKIKPLSEFYRKGKGLQSWCKDCCKEHGKLRNGSTGGYRKEIDYNRDTLLQEIKERVLILREKFGDKVIFCIERVVKEEF